MADKRTITRRWNALPETAIVGTQLNAKQQREITLTERCLVDRKRKETGPLYIEEGGIVRGSEASGSVKGGRQTDRWIKLLIKS